MTPRRGAAPAPRGLGGEDPDRSETRWWEWGQSSSILHLGGSKVNSANTIKTTQSHSKAQFPAVIFLAAGFRQGHEVTRVGGHSYRTGIPLPQLMRFHLSTSTRQGFASMHASLQRSQPHHSTRIAAPHSAQAPIPGRSLVLSALA